MLVKIGMELPFTSKNKHRNTILKFDFLKVPFCTPEKTHFWSLKKTAPKKFSFCFGFDSALKTINAQMFFWLAFLKTHKKSYWMSKTPFWPFLVVNNGFWCKKYFKNVFYSISSVFTFKQAKEHILYQVKWNLKKFKEKHFLCALLG